MIDLRYIVRRTKASSANVTKMEKVLQWRTKTAWFEGSTTTNGRRGWTEWTDVPEVYA